MCTWHTDCSGMDSLVFGSFQTPHSLFLVHRVGPPSLSPQQPGIRNIRPPAPSRDEECPLCRGNAAARGSALSAHPTSFLCTQHLKQPASNLAPGGQITHGSIKVQQFRGRGSPVLAQLPVVTGASTGSLPSQGLFFFSPVGSRLHPRLICL